LCRAARRGLHHLRIAHFRHEHEPRAHVRLRAARPRLDRMVDLSHCARDRDARRRRGARASVASSPPALRTTVAQSPRADDFQVQLSRSPRIHHPIRTRDNHYDVIIIGTGAGGGTLAYKLAPSGKRILLLERGEYVPREPQNWSTLAVNVHARYNTKEAW